MSNSLEELFCLVDDFCQEFMPVWENYLIQEGIQKKRWLCVMSASEIMTIAIKFHQSRYRDFKTYYIKKIQCYLGTEFPDLLSYSRFTEQMHRIIIPLYYFLQQQGKNLTGIYFVDATPLRVCHIKREKQHKVFTGMAQKGKTSMGWFFGFKLHLVINDQGEIISFKLTPGNVDDRVPVDQLTTDLFGKLFGDKGYIKKELTENLLERGLLLITKTKKNMKNKLVPMVDRILLRKRAIIESVIDQLKNISQIEHSRHRSPLNFIVNVLSGLIAYNLQPKKPSLGINGFQLCLVDTQ